MGVSERMSRQRSRDTRCELSLRRVLHRAGLRYRVHRRPLRGVRREADIVFGPSRVAVFVDGCFWHQCPEHGTLPATNRDWWKAKLDRNRERDLETDRLLDEKGWLAVRVWEHEDPEVAARRVIEAVRARHAK